MHIHEPHYRQLAQKLRLLEFRALLSLRSNSCSVRRITPHVYTSSLPFYALCSGGRLCSRIPLDWIWPFDPRRFIHASSPTVIWRSYVSSATCSCMRNSLHLHVLEFYSRLLNVSVIVPRSLGAHSLVLLLPSSSAKRLPL